jgi:hypothetical protein
MRRWLLVALSVALAVSVFAPVAAAQGDDGQSIISELRNRGYGFVTINKRLLPPL